MADKQQGEGGKPLHAGGSIYRRVGHKGADAITQGNTIESFEAAVEHGVDMIEIDVLRIREGRLVIAHDHHDASTRRPLELTEALDAFLEPPLDQVEIDCDLKLAGREAELAGALAGHGLVERAMVSTMETESLQKLRLLEPELRLGWTYPKTRRDWTQYGWAVPGVAAGLAAMRRRFPKTLAHRAPEMDVDAVWAFHKIITPKLVEAAEEAGVDLIAWTVDDLDRMVDLVRMGVHGVCSNDPRLFEKAERIVSGEAAPEEKLSKREAKKAEKQAKKLEKDVAKAEKKEADAEADADAKADGDAKPEKNAGKPAAKPGKKPATRAEKAKR
jgi:glycerophosphoryl diester phosphodiesterase